MTREQFLNGTSFYLPNVILRTKDTYAYKDEMIVQEVRDSEGRVLFVRHEANVKEIGRVGFTALSYVLDKRVIVKLKFEDLEEAN